MKDKLKLTCVPRFLIYEGGKLKLEINGARYVELKNAIEEFLPQTEE